MKLMSKFKNIIISATIIFVCLILLFFNFNTKEHIKGKMKIGVSDDTSGFVINYMTEKNEFDGLEIDKLLDKYSVADC